MASGCDEAGGRGRHLQGCVTFHPEKVPEEQLGQIDKRKKSLCCVQTA